MGNGAKSRIGAHAWNHGAGDMASRENPALRDPEYRFLMSFVAVHADSGQLVD